LKTHLNKLSIHSKISISILATSLFVLFLFGTIFVIAEVQAIRSEMASNLALTTDLVGNYASEALIQKKRMDLAHVLAKFDVRDDVRGAYLFNHAGDPYASYLAPESYGFVSRAIRDDFDDLSLSFWKHSQQQKQIFNRHHLSFFSPVYFRDKKVGTLYVVSDLSGLYRRLYGALLAGLIVFGLLVPIAVLISRVLARSLANPVLVLLEKMTHVSNTGDFKVRVERSSADEIGQLVDGFNEMLTQIELRDQRLLMYQKNLEATVEDRTKKLKETVQKLEASVEAAEAANIAKSNFLANMTHELRTPLIGVLGMNELLSRTSLNTHQQSLVETVHSSGENLLALINDVLDFSKIEAECLELEAVDTCYFEVVEETAKLLYSKAFTKGLYLVCDIDASSRWRVSADPVRLRQIIFNLLSNAIKFTDRGGVVVRLDMAEHQPGIGRFTLTVEDSGRGMSTDVQQQVFDAFVQADVTTTRKFGGTGLGLSIVQQLTTLMKGDVRLESQPDEGTRFTVELDLPLIVPNQVSLPADLVGRNVLVYDHSPAQRRALKSSLAGMGVQAVMADSADHAWCCLTGISTPSSFDVAFVAQESRLSDGSRLLDLCAQELKSTGVRIVEIAELPEGQTPHMSNTSGEVVLYRPIITSDVAHCLIRRIKSIELVANRSDDVATNPGAVSAPACPDRASDQRHVLLVEDNAVTRELVMLFLGKFDLRITQADTGLAALDAADRETFDMILMDCNMPEMDGIETTRRLRDKGVTVPIVAMTAHIDTRIYQACTEAGMNDALKKPFHQSELDALINKWLGEGGDSECSSLTLDVVE